MLPTIIRLESQSSPVEEESGGSYFQPLSVAISQSSPVEEDKSGGVVGGGDGVEEGRGCGDGESTGGERGGGAVEDEGIGSSGACRGRGGGREPRMRFALNVEKFKLVEALVSQGGGGG